MQTVELTVPTSFAYDYLSILQIKWYQSKDDKALENFDRCYLELISKLGEVLAKDVYWSPEYEELFRENLKIFQLVDELKKNPEILAITVDQHNWNRAQIKKRIQEKFFGGGAVEQKFGYAEEIK
jgi:hypothetical protein